MPTKTDKKYKYRYQKQNAETKAGISPEEKKALIEMQPFLTKPRVNNQKPDHYAGPSLEVRY